MQSTSSVHMTLAHSYFVYFIGSILGLFADTLVGFAVVLPYSPVIAITCFILGAGLILWAQRTSRHSVRDTTKPYFMRGPYRYMRNPTHLGLVVLVVGYTVVSGSVIFCAVTLIGYLVSNIFFRKYESLLKQTYDGAYEHYQSNVPKIL